QAFASKLMAALVLAQAVSGWCCHRPCHCLDGEVAELSSIGIEGLAQSQCCHDDHVGLVLNASSPCQCHECHGFCTFVTGSKQQIAQPNTGAALDTIATNSASDQTQFNAEWSQVPAASTHLVPPLRLHLLHQSLLI